VTFPRQARIDLWNVIAGAGGENLTVRLIGNNITITEDSSISDIEYPTYDGYAALTSSSWTPPTLQPNGDITVTSPIFVFTHGPVNDMHQVYGWCVTYELDGDDVLLCAEMFDIPYTMNTPLNQVPVPIQLNLRDLAA